MHPNVAIILTNYNYGEFVINAINSIQNQSYEGEIRIYLIDDGSSDNSWDKICSITEPYTTKQFNISSYKGTIERRINFNLKRHLYAIRIENSGASVARNFAIWESWSWAEIYGILDADDEYKPEKVAKLTEALSSYDDVGVAYADYDIHKNYGHYNYIKEELKTSYSLEELSKRCIVHSGSLIKKRFLEQIILPNNEIFDSRLHGPSSKGFIGCTEDYDLWLRLCKICIFCHVPESLSIVNETGKNQSMKMTNKIFNENSKILNSRI